MKSNSLVRISTPLQVQDLEAMVSGENEYLYDENGKRYIDLCSGIWNVPFGYSNSYINEYINKQLHKLPFCNLINNVGDLHVEYAERLVNLLDAESILYTCSGSESVEAAIKVCRQYQKMRGSHRKALSAFILSYHGTSYGAMSVSGVDVELCDKYSPYMPEVLWIDVPQDVDDEEKWNNIIEDHFFNNYDKMAGIIVEPIIASGGVIPIPKNTLVRIQELCNKYDILFVVDEVSTGFGRTGTLFLYKEYKLNPDLICLSKGITNGYLPLGVLVFSERVINEYIANGEVIEHFSSQGGNLVSIAAAMAVLDLLENYSEYQVYQKGEYFKEILKEELKGYNDFKVRGKGLMVGIEFPMYPHKFMTIGNMITTIINNLRKKGILVYNFCNYGHNIGLSFLPPFIIEMKDLKKYARIIAKNIKKVYM